jgi:hypothetical protein
MAKTTKHDVMIFDGVAPVTHSEFNLPPDGVGVMILQGTHGLGKDRCIAAITRLVTGDKSYTADVDDHAEKGKVSFAGGGLSVGQKIVSTGECEYAGINPSLIEGLINPPYKSEDAAEQYRIESLIDLAKVKADCTLFESLCQDREEFDRIMPPDLCEETSLVKMASLVEAAFQKEARSAESDAAQENANATAKRGATSDLDLTAESDGKILEMRLAAAMQAEADIKAADNEAVRAAGLAENARKQLATSESGYTGKTVEQATNAYQTAVGLKEQADAVVADLKLRLSAAEKAASICANDVEQAITAGRAARQHEETVKAWRESLAASVPPRPSADELAKASQSVHDARKAVETGALVRRAKEQSSEVLGHAERAESLKKKAERLREAAKGTDDILSQAVAKANCPLKVYRGRLVMKTDRSDRERFTDLSGGEKLLVALEIALRTVPNGKKALLPITPRTWSELEPRSEHKIAEMARENGVLIVTGRCTSDETLSSVSL